MKMDKKDLKVGDIVILKSDSLKHFPTYMTVDEVGPDKATCVWSSKDGDFNERTFSIETLMIYSENE